MKHKALAASAMLVTMAAWATIAVALTQAAIALSVVLATMAVYVAMPARYFVYRPNASRN